MIEVSRLVYSVQNIVELLVCALVKEYTVVNVLIRSKIIACGVHMSVCLLTVSKVNLACTVFGGEGTNIIAYNSPFHCKR